MGAKASALLLLVAKVVRGGEENNATRGTMHMEWFASPKAYDAARARSVALCVAGQVRSFSHARVQANWEETIFSPVDPDIFFHASHQLRRCKRRDATQLQKSKTGDVALCVEEEWSTPRAEMAAVVEWLRRWRLVQVSVMHDDDILRSGVRPAASDLAQAPRQWEGNVSRPCPVLRGNNVRPQLALRWWGCYTGILRAERELRNAQYEMVMRLRPDLFIPCKMPSTFGSRLRTDVIAAFNDFGWIAARELGLGALGVARYSKSWSKPDPHLVCPPSCGARNQCFDHHVLSSGGRIFAWKQMQSLWVIERYGDQAPGVFQSVVTVHEHGKNQPVRVIVTCHADLRRACRPPAAQRCDDLVAALTAAAP